MLVGGVAIAVVGASLVLAVVSVVVRYRSGGERIRLQIRWLMLAGAAVVVLLMAGWVAQNVFGATTLVYMPFLFAIVLLVPLAVAVAVTRYDLFDIDRLLGQSVIWFVTLACSAAVFGLVVVLVSQLVHEVTAAGSAAAAFVTALALLPLHRLVNDFVGRLVDPDRYLAVAAVERFAADVRAGRHDRRTSSRLFETRRATPSSPCCWRVGPAAGSA